MTTREAGRGYSEADFQAAYRAISAGKMSLHKAAARYNVPRSTLSNRIQKRQLAPVRKGPATALTHAEEQRLAAWILRCWATGFSGCREAHISSTARALFEQSGRTTLYSKFSRRWFATYLKRHARVRDAMTDKPMWSKQADWSFDAAQLSVWFERVERFVATADGVDLAEALCQPTRIFHCSHATFGRVGGGVMLAYGADGRAVPPLILTPAAGVEAQQPTAAVAALPKGWAEFKQNSADTVNDKVLEHYLTQVLWPFLKHAGVAFPVLVFLQQQAEPPSLALYEVCKELDIVLLNLYPSAFRYLRRKWQKPLHAWHAHAPPEQRDFAAFIETLKDALVYNLTKSDIKEAFKSAGIFPFLVDSVDTSWLVQSMATPTEDVAAEADIPATLSYVMDPTQETLLNSQPNSLGFAEFKCIIGAAQLMQLQELDMLTPNSDEYSQEFLALQRIYQRFRLAETVTPKCENLASENEEEEGEHYECLEEADKVYDEYLLAQ